MGLRDVAVLRSYDNDSIPEVLLTLVIAQPLSDDIRLSDIAAGVTNRFLIISKKKVDASSLSLVAFQQFAQI